MASKCKVCNDEITSTEFVKCHGTCANVFHSKCVMISKTLLNALCGNPNIRWYCHDCHINNSNFASSMNEIKTSIGQLSCSLSSDLGRFLNSMSEMTKCVTDSIKSLSTATGERRSTPEISSKRRREETFQSNPRKFRRVARQSSNISPSSTTNDGHESNLDSRKSIVVSNIAPDITADALKKFLVSKLAIDEENIKITTLMPRSLKSSDVKFMQFRISTPESVYESVRSQSIWPTGVRVRDFVFKRAKATQPSTPPVEKSKFDVPNVVVLSPSPTNEAASSDNQMNNIGNMDFQMQPTKAATVLPNANTNQTDSMNC